MWSTSWLFLLEAVIIVVGNLTTIVIFITTRRLRSRKYILIVNMAFADLFVGCITLPCYVYWRVRLLKVQDETTEMTFQYFFEFADTFFGTASIFSLTSLAIERAHATFFPFKHEALRFSSYRIGIALVWLAALTNTLLSLSVLQNLRIPRLYVMAFVLTLSLAIVSIAYLLIWTKVTRNGNAAIGSNKKLTVTLGMVTVASFITLMPLLITSIYGVICPSCLDNLQRSLFSIATFFYCGNSAVNFFIYAFRLRYFRAELYRRFGCCKKSSSQQDGRIEMQENMKTAPTRAFVQSEQVAASECI